MRIIFLLLLTALPTFARLGETKAECEARYGKPLGTSGRSANPFYRKGDHQIVIGFLDDKAVFLLFTKLKPDTQESDLPVGILDSAPMPESEMNILLQANGGTFKWTQHDNKDGDPAWELSDGKGYAEYVDRSLEIRNKPAFEEWKKARDIKRAAGIPHLGETKAELEKRCGKPEQTYADGSLVYRTSSFKIVATFLNDKAGSLMFQSTQLYKGAASKLSGTPRPDPLYGDEIRALLKASAGDSTWENSPTNEDLWIRADKKAHAVYDMNEYVMTIVDNEFSEYEDAKDEKEAAAKFKDFGGLGKTKAECEALYGKPFVSPADGPYGYHKAGLGILITYWNDKAAKLDFAKIDAKNPDADRESLLYAERSALLKSFGGNSDWVQTKDPEDGTITWLRKDRKVIAEYDPDEKLFSIYAYDYFLHLSEEVTDGKKAKPLDGF